MICNARKLADQLLNKSATTHSATVPPLESPPSSSCVPSELLRDLTDNVFETDLEEIYKKVLQLPDP